MQNDNLRAMLELLLGALKSTSDFAIEQAPLVLREMLWWSAGEAVLWMVVFLTIAAVIHFKLAPLVAETAEAELAAPWLRFLSIGVALAAVGFNGATLLKIWLAPRLFLVERIAALLSGKP